MKAPTHTSEEAGLTTNVDTDKNKIRRRVEGGGR